MTTTGEIYDKLDGLQLTYDELVVVLVHFAKTRPNDLDAVLDSIAEQRK